MRRLNGETLEAGGRGEGAERDFWGEKSKNIQHEIVVEIRRRDKSHQRHADMQIFVLFFNG